MRKFVMFVIVAFLFVGCATKKVEIRKFSDPKDVLSEFMLAPSRSLLFGIGKNTLVYIQLNEINKNGEYEVLSTTDKTVSFVKYKGDSIKYTIISRTLTNNTMTEHSTKNICGFEVQNDNNIKIVRCGFLYDYIYKNSDFHRGGDGFGKEIQISPQEAEMLNLLYRLYRRGRI